MASSRSPGETDRAPFYRLDVLFASWLLALAYVLLAGLGVGGPAFVLLGAAMLFFVPGYSVASLVFVRGSGLPLAGDFAATIGFSVVFNGLVGLLLLGLHLGLNVTLLAVAIAAVCACATLVAALSPSKEMTWRVPSFLRRELGLTHLPRAQRRAAFALLAGILVATSGLFYVAGLHPATTPVVQIILESSTGSRPVASLTGSAGQVLGVIVAVLNGPPSQDLTLSVGSHLVGTSNSTSVPINWTNPLRLGAATLAHTSILLSGDRSTQLQVQFTFETAGQYTLEFGLSGTGGSSLASQSLSVTVQ